MRKTEIMMEVRYVTERFPSGAVKATAPAYHAWFPLGTSGYTDRSDTVVVTPSTDFKGETIRTVRRSCNCPCHRILPGMDPNEKPIFDTCDECIETHW